MLAVPVQGRIARRLPSHIALAQPAVAEVLDAPEGR